MTDTGPLILVIDDETPIRRFLRVTLTSHGYRTVEAASAQDGLRLATAQPPNVVLLDLGLPDMDGLEVARRLREWSDVPIIVLTARDREQDKIVALDSGADDYLTKPFSVGELLARVRVALRHAARAGQGGVDPVLIAGELRIDLAQRRVTLAGTDIHLTPTQYQLLAVLARYAGRVVTHRQLLREVWGPNATEETQYLRVYVGQIRQKIEADPARPRYLLTEPGVGYRLDML